MCECITTNNQTCAKIGSRFTQKYGKRNSNIEILRILSMFMILGLHVNVFSLGTPTAEECYYDPIPSFTRCALEMICIIAVNLFVLISGWFSIKVRIKGLMKFLFQCFFILSFVYLIGLSIGKATLSTGGILQCFCLLGNAWFVPSYIGLYLLSPFLNLFCEKATEKQLRYFLIGFYIFQTMYGNVYTNVGFIANGYSTFSFIGLYILARYFNLYGRKYARFGTSLYLISTIILIGGYWVTISHGSQLISNMFYIYTCPFNITAALGLLLMAVYMRERNNSVINFVAGSVFSVYLCHICLHWTTDLYRETSRSIFNEYSGLSYIVIIVAFIFGVFTLSIIVDQFRKLIWSSISYRNLRIRSFSNYQNEYEKG